MTEELTNVDPNQDVPAVEEEPTAGGMPGVKVPAGPQVPGQDLNQGATPPVEEAPVEEAPAPPVEEAPETPQPEAPTPTEEIEVPQE